MPIYEYRCLECGTDFERFVAGQMTVECPTCQSREIRRRLSLFGMKTGSAGGGGACCAAGRCGCHS